MPEPLHAGHAGGRGHAAEGGLTAPTVLQAVRIQASQRPDKLAIRFLPDGDVDSSAVQVASYAELDRRVNGIAAHLQAAGAAGERVVLLVPPGIDYIAGFLACMAAGALAVPAYPPGSSAHAQRIAGIAADARARFVLSNAALAARRHETLATTAPALVHAHWIAVDAAEQAAPADRPAQAPVDGLAFLQYTSGSTADPRGVQVTHANLMQHARTFVVADVPAGAHEIVSEGSNTSTLKLSTEPGESVFIQQVVQNGAFQFVRVPQAQGRIGVMSTALVHSDLMKPGGTLPMASGTAAGQAAAAARAALARSAYAYEAERAAKERGCMGPNGIRPAAALRAKEGVIEEFDVACSASVQRVRCDMGMCTVVR